MNDSKKSVGSIDEFINLIDVTNGVDDAGRGGGRVRKAAGSVRHDYETVDGGTGEELHNLMNLHNNKSNHPNHSSATSKPSARSYTPANTTFDADDDQSVFTTLNSSPEIVDEANDDLDMNNFNHNGGNSSVMSATFNFVNSIVGAGVIGLPFALSEAGFWMGIFMIIGLAVLVNWTVLLLVKTSKLAGRSSYQDLVEYCFGKIGLISISLFQFLFAFGGMCAYTVIVGDNLTIVFRKLLGNNSTSVFASRRFIIFLTSLCITFPLSLYRDISKLAKTSILAFFALLYIIIAVMIEGPRQDQSAKEFPSLDLIHPSFLQATGIISFAFVCHHNSFLIYGSLHTPTLDRWKIVTNWSTGLSCLLSLMLAVPGYLIFGSKTYANILNNFSDNNLVMNIARFMFAMNMFTTFPLECFVCREVIEHYYFRGQQASRRLNVIITGLLTAVSCMIALITCDLGIVLEVTGCFSATAVAYILPAACYLKMASGPVFSLKKIGPLLCIILGVAIMCLSTTMAIVEYSKSTRVKDCHW